MIDCSINIDDLIQNHPEDARSTFGIGENDNLLILAPEDDGRGCVFLDNRIDDYNGLIRAFILVGVGYVASALSYMHNGSIVKDDVEVVDEDNRIYYREIKPGNYTCSSDNGIQVITNRQRFLVDVHICEGGDDKVSIRNGSRYVGYGDNAPLTAAIIGDATTYMVSWTDVTDPEHPVPLTPDTYASRQDENRQDYSRIGTSTCTLRNITSNRSIEVCYQRIPKEYTFRLFTNDGKINNLELQRMTDDYVLGNVGVNFMVNGEATSISTTRYGVIHTYDFQTNTFGTIEYPENHRHYFDRGIILYHVTDMDELTIWSNEYEVDCCYVECDPKQTSGCEKALDAHCKNPKTKYTEFLGWVKTPGDTNNYNNLPLCNLDYHTFEWEQIEEPNVSPEFIHEQDTINRDAKCSDFHYITANQYYVPYEGSLPPYAWVYFKEVSSEIYADYIPFPDESFQFNEYTNSYMPADYIVVYCWITPTNYVEKIFKLETETPGYFSRNLMDGTIDMQGTCYTYEQEWESEFTTTFSNDTTLYAVFKPKTSEISLEIASNIEYYHTIGIIDYCNSYKYFELDPSEVPPNRIIAFSSLPLTVDSRSYEYIRVGNTYYQKRPYYRETGVTSTQTLTFDVLNGMNVFLGILGENNDDILNWKISQDNDDISEYFSGKGACFTGLPYECKEIEFVMCGDIKFKAIKK